MSTNYFIAIDTETAKWRICLLYVLTCSNAHVCGVPVCSMSWAGLRAWLAL